MEIVMNNVICVLYVFASFLVGKCENKALKGDDMNLSLSDAVEISKNTGKNVLAVNFLFRSASDPDHLCYDVLRDSVIAEIVRDHYVLVFLDEAPPPYLEKPFNNKFEKVDKKHKYETMSQYYKELSYLFVGERRLPDPIYCIFYGDYTFEKEAFYLVDSDDSIRKNLFAEFLLKYAGVMPQS